MAALKGLEWDSPRGKMSIDPQTRDVVQDVYIRRVERKDGELYNVEFDVVRQVKDPYRQVRNRDASSGALAAMPRGPRSSADGRG